MPVPGNSKSHLREAAINRTAALEQLIFQVECAHKNAAGYHNSELACRSIGNAHASLTESIRSLSLGHYERVDRLLNVTWFYAKFAQDIVSAEATEHLLGNDHFIDLIEPVDKIQKDLKALLSRAGAMLDELQELIPQGWELSDDYEAGKDT